MQHNNPLKPLLVLALLAIARAGGAAVFVSPGGAIPDADPVGLELEFAVSGITPMVHNVSVELEMTHTYVGDLVIELKAPGDIASLVLVGRPGYGRVGTPGVTANFAGTYAFSDRAESDFWAAIAPLASFETVPSGSYRTTTGAAVPFGSFSALSNRGGCSTYLSGAFSGLDASEANGTWTLTIADHGGGDVGVVTAAALRINEVIFTDGFETGGTNAWTSTSPRAGLRAGLPEPWIIEGSSVLGSCDRAQYDFTGTGRTSYAVTSNGCPGGATGVVCWHVQSNDSLTPTGPVTATEFGLDGDFLIPGDFDGDGKADMAVWRGIDASNGLFEIRRSSRPLDEPLMIPGGRLDDDPAQFGDFDGDGVDDLAISRFPATSGLGTFFVYGSASGGLERSFPTVIGQSFTAFPVGGFDFTGDGIADVAVQTTSQTIPGDGRFRILSGIDGSVVADVAFGLDTDLIILGDHVGDEVPDITVERIVGNVVLARNWFSLDGSDLSTAIGPTILGLTGDYVLSGDWDGDGKDDYATWRPSGSKYVIKLSTTGAEVEVPFGAFSDYPVANARVN